mmetsp:Transcript_24408/g.45440  ORF Transcript_24408/g.45440 Transcript_24408/m.45440 type:complete len:936 (+) Transcript_24408:181-2988(+)
MTDRLDRKLSPRLLPSINNEVDFSSLDYQGVDVFLASFSSSDKANVTKHMTKQLKALRALLAVTGKLSCGATSDATIHSIMETTSTIINAEKLFVMDIDHKLSKLVVTYSPDNSRNGVRTSCDTGIEASVIAQKKGVVVNDLSSSTLLNVDLYEQLQVSAKNVVAVPIILGDTVMGLLLGFNKQADDFNFSNFDISCLETVASSIAIVYQCSILSKFRPVRSEVAGDSPTSVANQTLPNAVSEVILQEIVDDAYRLLGAGRISVFVDHGNEDLLCISSQDMRGAVVPSSSGSGFVGECYRHRAVFNIPNVKVDKRHSSDMDERTKYDTVALLCVPLFGLNDELLGVMEAVNNKPGVAFSSSHEVAMQQLGQRVGLLLSRLKAIALQNSTANVTIVRNLGDFSAEVCGGSSKSVAQLVDAMQKYGRNIAQSDYVYFFSSTTDSTTDNITLENKHHAIGGAEGWSRCQGGDIHAKVLDALVSKQATEFYLSEADSAEQLLPGIMTKIALIIPLVPFTPSKSMGDVLIVTRKARAPAAVSFSPESEVSEINLDSVFANVVESYAQKSFNALESQGLTSLASIFKSALRFMELSAVADRADTKAQVEEAVLVASQFDCPTVLSTLCAEDQQELSKLFEWQFNVLNIKEKASLHYAVVALFDKEFNFGELNICREKVLAYILEVDRSYLMNPFHNFYHAVCVTHFDYMLLNASHAKTILSPVMIFASLLSALVHDVAHPGNTNMYEINMRSDLAILYNDTSVLENHHCSTAFRLMNKEGLGIFDGLEFAERAEIRKMMIACIIATDMHYHVSLIELISNRASQEKWQIDNFTERMNYGKILLHAADLSNPTRPFATSKAWAERVSEEFNAQGKNEKENGIPVSTFLLSHDLKSFVKNELFFSGHIVFPMWKELVRLYPTMSHITDQIATNLESWKGLIKK